MTFNININSIINVLVLKKGIEKINKIIITNDKGYLFKKDIEYILIKAKKYKKLDKIKIEYINIRNILKLYIYLLKNTIFNLKINKKLNITDKSTLKEKIDKTIKWFDKNILISIIKQKLLKGVVNSIIVKMYEVNSKEDILNNIDKDSNSKN